MLAGAGLTDAGENVPLAVLMRAGGNWIEPSVLPAASSSLCSAHDSDPLNVSKINSKTASEAHRFILNCPPVAPYS
jgi:hypothetical protein